MITLISRWPLADGCPGPLLEALRRLADEVRTKEPGTLSYLVHLPAPGPSDTHPDPDPDRGSGPAGASRTPGLQPAAVTFFEVYRDGAAFQKHLDGPAFTQFREDYLSYFVEDPTNPGWPRSTTTFLERLAGFVDRG
jgi:quinol monooxygenase YgiN